MARAAVLHNIGDRQVDLRDDVTAVEVEPGLVKVRIRATGICQTDLSTMSGTLPATQPTVLGHEGAGEIVEVGENVTGLAPGDHVVINWTPNCGNCAECHRGQPYLCVSYIGDAFGTPRFRLGDGTGAYGLAGIGTWADEIAVPAPAAVKIDDDVPFEYAALLGCGVPTGVGAVLNTAGVRPGATVAVVGAGGVGLSVIQGARIAGASTILAIDPNTAKHETARTFGATHVATLDDHTEQTALLTGGGFDYAFEVVGRASAVQTAWQVTRRGGDVIVVGAGGVDDMWEMSAFSLLFEGKSLKASLYGECDMRRDIPRFVDLWRKGELNLEPLISRRIGFAEINDAIEALRGGDVIRQVILFD